MQCLLTFSEIAIVLALLLRRQRLGRIIHRGRRRFRHGAENKPKNGIESELEGESARGVRGDGHNPSRLFSPCSCTVPEPSESGKSEFYELGRRTRCQWLAAGSSGTVQQLHRRPLFGLDEQVDKRLIVPRLAEDIHPAIAAVEHMIDNAAIGGAGGAWHAAKDKQMARVVKETMDVTLSASIDNHTRFAENLPWVASC